MRVSKFVLVGALLASSSFASASDLPTRKAPPPPPSPMYSSPVFSWTGFYIGGYAGGSFGQVSEKDLGFPAFTGALTTDISGFTGGGLVGYNQQMNWLVVGVEAEYGYDGASGKSGFVNGNGFASGTNFSQDWVQRDRGRVGVAMDRWLVFADGGISFKNFDTSFYQLAPDATGNTYLAKLNGHEVGFNVGGGFEYAFTNNWIGRVEYIYDGYSDKGINSGIWDAHKLSLDNNTARVGLEYKF